MIPDWDINNVLRELKGPRFKVEACSLEDLLSKTLFLILIATGNRASEIAAIQRDTILFRANDREVLLSVSPNFLFKNQNQRRSPPNIVIRKFDDVDPELCPVRHLKEYLRRSKDSAEGTALFLHPNTGRNLQRPSIALKMVRLIEGCCPGSIPKCHDLRKQAASIAWCRGVDPGDIVNAVFWSSSDVFLKHYLFKSSEPQLNVVALNTL